MIIQHFNAVKTLLESNFNDDQIKKIDWFNDQYNRYEDLKAVPFPNVLIEFPDDIVWMQVGNGVQQADIEIGIHCVIKDLDDKPNSIYEFAGEIYKAINKKVLWDGTDQLSTELVRVRSNKVTPDSNLKVITLYFSTNILDTSAAPETVPVQTGFTIS